MSASTPTVTKIDDAALISIIRKVQRRLVFIAPGTTLNVAKAIQEQWQQLGSQSVNVILDVDPEVCRLGYGTLDALKLLQETATQLGVFVHHQPGIRIGLVIADDTTLIFAPIPLLIEAGPTSSPPDPASASLPIEVGSSQPNYPNAIRLDFVPPTVAKEVGLGDRGVLDQTVGQDSFPAT
jgi:hypothetical protein